MKNKDYDFLLVRNQTWVKLGMSHSFQKLFWTMVEEGQIDPLRDCHLTTRDEYDSFEARGYGLSDGVKKVLQSVNQYGMFWLLLKRPALEKVKRRWLKIMRGNQKAAISRVKIDEAKREREYLEKLSGMTPEAEVMRFIRKRGLTGEN